MATAKQALGKWGEQYVSRMFACPKCKTAKSLRTLPVNFKCADIICDFCGYLAQVKTMSVQDVESPPNHILGAAWRPQERRMAAGIFFPLFIVLKAGKRSAVYYLPTEFQSSRIFKKRAPLSMSARRAGWQGFVYDLRELQSGYLVRIHP